MLRNIKIIPIIVTIIIGVVLQLGLTINDMKDTPYRAVKEFTVAYFKADKSMADRICEERKTADGVDVVDQYIYKKTVEAKDRGLSKSYLNEKLNHLRLDIAECNECNNSFVKIKVTGRTKPVLKAFFTGEDYKEIDEIISVVKKGKMWKVCGKLFSLPGN